MLGLAFGVIERATEGVRVMLGLVLPDGDWMERAVDCDRCVGAVTFDGVRTTDGLCRTLLAPRLELTPLDREKDGDEFDIPRPESTDLGLAMLPDGDRVMLGERELDPNDVPLGMLASDRR